MGYDRYLDPTAFKAWIFRVASLFYIGAGKNENFGGLIHQFGAVRVGRCNQLCTRLFILLTYLCKDLYYAYQNELCGVQRFGPRWGYRHFLPGMVTLPASDEQWPICCR